MRDILTVIAALVIAALTAAVAVPPFIDWSAQRAVIDGMLSRATGTAATTGGRIEVRLLPSPRIRVDALELGGSTPSSPSLLARNGVVAEIALMPLLSGHVRFTDVRLGRAEIRIASGPGGKWRLPSDLPAVSGLRREWAIENLAAQQLVLIVTDSDGEPTQYHADDVRIEGQSLIGPWRGEGLITIDGLVTKAPFRLATGELGADQTMLLKLIGGSDIHPRFDIDAKLAFENEGNGWAPSLSGVAKALFGPPVQVSAAGIPVPVTIQAGFKTKGASVELDPVAVEAGEGGASLRLTGTGLIRGEEDPRISLKLESRRVDGDSFFLSASWREFAARTGTWSWPPIPMPIELDLFLGSISLAQEELSDLVARLTFDRDGAKVERIEVQAPGQTRLAFTGGSLTSEGGVGGRAEMTSAASDRLARYLGKLGVPGPVGTFLAGRPFEMTADLEYSALLASLRNVDVKLGDSRLTGEGQYQWPDASSRGRFEAKIKAQGLDLAQSPPRSSLFEALRNMDINIDLDARDVRYPGTKGAGQIVARISSRAQSVDVEKFEIRDIAGANAQVSGRIEPDGSGRIEGRVTAVQAAPLVDLMGTVWIGGVSRYVPHFLREGDLDIRVITERASASERSGGLRLTTKAWGTAAGGSFNAEALSAEGDIDDVDLKLSTDNTGLWVDRPDAVVLRRPSHLELRGKRVPSGKFNVTVAGDVGGVRIKTTRPIALGFDDDVLDSGEADLTAADITPFLVLLGDGAGVEPPVPAEVRVALGRERDAPLVMLSGRVADARIDARLFGRTRSEVTGTVTAERLSMPWLAAAFALNAPADPRATSLWSTARFGQTRRVLNGGQVRFNVPRLDLGRGLVAGDASFDFALTPDGIAVRDFKGALAGGELTGAFSIARQGSLASVAGEGAVRDVPLGGLSTGSAFGGKISGTLKFGAAGETMSGLVANLAGAGTARIADLRVANADPTALERSIARSLKESDPLAARRLEAIVADELGRAPLQGQVLSAPTTLIGGALRISPFIADAGAANWQGAVSLDFKTLALEAKGALSAKTIPKGWTGNPPYVHLGWRGSLDQPAREIDVAPLVNGLAGIVLQRELEKIESFEADANERTRVNQRRSMEWSREQARQAEEAARQREEEARQRAAEEAARSRAAEEARRRAEEARQVRLRQQQEERARGLQSPYGPMDIKPPAQTQQPPG